MADMHIITGGRHAWRVVMHFAVQNVNNAVGVNYRTALINSGLASVSVLPDGDGNDGTISATEKTALDDGSIYEHVESLVIDGPGTDTASRVAMLKAEYASIETRVIDSLKHRLKFFGHNQAK